MGPFTEEDRQAVVNAVLGAFDGFTVQEAQGYFRGRPVATLLIGIATQDTGAVECVAEARAAELARGGEGMGFGRILRNGRTGRGRGCAG